jgi:hypothetical protein
MRGALGERRAQTISRMIKSLVACNYLLRVVTPRGVAGRSKPWYRGSA